jgi:undecaprenyl pyrophosphate synthase
MTKLLETVHDLMKLSKDGLEEALLDPKYNKANLRMLLKQSVALLKEKNEVIHVYEEKKEKQDEKICVACGGSGVYDTFGSPPCGACDGAGFEK